MMLAEAVYSLGRSRLTTNAISPAERQTIPMNRARLRRSANHWFASKDSTNSSRSPETLSNAAPTEDSTAGAPGFASGPLARYFNDLGPKTLQPYNERHRL